VPFDERALVHARLRAGTGQWRECRTRSRFGMFSSGVYERKSSALL
jgi:hypothetical protein